jgi:hypothetical protein
MALVDDVLREFRTRLLERDGALQADYTRRWIRVQDALQAQIDALAGEIAVMSASGNVDQNAVYQLQNYQSLLSQARRETEQFDRYVAGAIEKEQYLAWADGIDYGTDSIRALWRSAGLEMRAFPVLDVERVRAMIGLSGDGSPLYNLLAQSYPQTVLTLTDALTQAIAQGWNPRKTAKEMQAAMTGNLQRALVVSRTEQMRAHRMAAVGQYRTSGVVVRYQRRAALSGRTCLACLLQDGRYYELQQQFSDHPNGRCSCVAVLVDVPEIEMQSGADYLLKLNPSGQRELMGEERYNAWKDGRITLEQMSRIHNHPTWGEAPQIVPMKEMIEK